MVTRKRKARTAKVASNRGALVAVNLEALSQAIAASGMSIRGLATAILGRQPAQFDIDSALAREHETIRKTLNDVYNRKQRRIRTALIVRVAKALGVTKSSLIEVDRVIPPAIAESASQRYAAKLAAQLLNDASKELVDPLRAVFETILDFDSWHHALGRSRMSATDPQLERMRVEFARHFYQALKVLFTPIGRARRTLEPDAVRGVFRSLLGDRNTHLHERLDALARKNSFEVLAASAADVVLQKMGTES